MRVCLLLSVGEREGEKEESRVVPGSRAVVCAGCSRLEVEHWVFFYCDASFVYHDYTPYDPLQLVLVHRDNRRESLYRCNIRH